MKKRRKPNQIALGVFLTLYAIIIIVPMIIMVIPTFQTVQESSQGIFTMPSRFDFSNYVSAWKRSNFPSAFMNSLIICVSTIAINIFIGSLAAFPIGIRQKSRLFRGTFLTFLVGLMLPFQSIMIPLYILMSRTLKLTNSYSGVVIVYVSMTLSLTIFFYSQFIASISKEMEEASVIDGCGYFHMFWKIYFPLLKPVTAAIIIQNILFLWNDLLVPLILIDEPAKKPIMPMVYMFFGTYYNEWNLAFSVLVLGALPLIVGFLLLQKQFISGISLGAVKG